jgi:hypothetical protein
LFGFDLLNDYECLVDDLMWSLIFHFHGSNVNNDYSMFSCLIFRFEAYTPTMLKPISSTNVPNLTPYMMLTEVKGSGGHESVILK